MDITLELLCFFVRNIILTLLSTIMLLLKKYYPHSA